MSPSQSLHLAAELEVAPDPVVAQYPEAVDYCSRLSYLLHHHVGIEIEIGGVRHSEYHCLGTPEGLVEVLFDPYLLQLLLVTEELCLALSLCRVAVLLFNLPPVFYVRVMYPDLGAHLRQLADDYLGAAVACVAYILAVCSPQHQHVCCR